MASRSTISTVLTALLAFASALAQPATEGSWELRACAPPQSLPFSDRNQAGFENRVAEIVAEELGARLTYDWTPFTEDLINLHFAEGTCDVILGVPDGFERGLNTVTYYQSPYVMIHRADSGLSIDSLDDPDLADLTMAVQGAGTPPQAALFQRGLNGNVIMVLGGSAGSDDRLAGLVKVVESGQVDVGFGWGPAVAYYAARSPVDFVVQPVSPQFEPPSIFQSVPMTMAVRRNDLALRDMLNLAIAARWDDIQAVLDEYDVPRTPVPAPFVGEPLAHLAPVTVEIGVVLPVPTGGRTVVAALNDITGEAALQGALLAEGVINSRAQETGTDVHLSLASAPSAEAAVRAAERLLAANGVDALVGGVGTGQAEALARIAEDRSVPLLNSGSSEALARRVCSATSFHLEPAPEQYFNAMAELYGSLAQGGAWFVVHVDDDEGRSMLDVATATISGANGSVVGSAAVEPDAPTFYGIFDEIAATRADVVAVVLPAPAQLTFMGQFEDNGGSAMLAPYPDPVTQTRNFLAASQDYGVGLGLPRLAAWESTLADGSARELNVRFTSRWGQPLNPTGWSTYEAVNILAQAARAAGSASPDELVAQLSSATPFDTSKGSATFDTSHRLSQQLYAVVPVPDAPWGITLGEKSGVARLFRSLPREDVSAPPCAR